MYKGCIFLVSNCQSADLFLSEMFSASHEAMQQLGDGLCLLFALVRVTLGKGDTRPLSAKLSTYCAVLGLVRQAVLVCA